MLPYREGCYKDNKIKMYNMNISKHLMSYQKNLQPTKPATGRFCWLTSLHKLCDSPDYLSNAGIA